MVKIERLIKNKENNLKIKDEEYEKINKQIVDEIEKDTFDDRAYGCVLGAFVADSCGSYNEFN